MHSFIQNKLIHEFVEYILSDLVASVSQFYVVLFDIQSEFYIMFHSEFDYQFYFISPYRPE